MLTVPTIVLALESIPLVALRAKLPTNVTGYIFLNNPNATTTNYTYREEVSQPQGYDIGYYGKDNTVRDDKGGAGTTTGPPEPTTMENGARKEIVDVKALAIGMMFGVGLAWFGMVGIDTQGFY